MVRSTTSRGSADINLFFDWKVDMFETLQRVNAELARVEASLPPSVRIHAQRLRFSTFPILGFGLTSGTISQTKLWELATYQIIPRLNRVNGVASVLLQGGEVPEYDIVPDPVKLLRASVTVPDILAAVQRTNLIQSPGLIPVHQNLVLDLVDGQVHDPREIADIVVKKTPAGIPVHIGDIASIAPDTQPHYTIVTANGKPGVLLSIDRQPGSNTVAVSEGVYKELNQIRQNTAAGHPVFCLLRPGGTRQGCHQQRSRCDPDRHRSGFHRARPVSAARLGAAPSSPAWSFLSPSLLRFLCSSCSASPST